METRRRRERFRALLGSGRCVHSASVFDPLSARIAEDLGYEVGMLAGSVASMTVTGLPDLMGLTLTEFADQVYRICRAGDLSLMVDADDGYGNALNVMRTVEELETAGLAALSIEDTDLPQPFGCGGKPQLISVEEGIGKMKAAQAARSDPALVVIGRTSALRITDLDDCIRRLSAYARAGVDALFPVDASREQIAAIHAAIDLPLIADVSSAEQNDLAHLRANGVRVALLGHAPFQAAVKAAHDTLKAMLEGTPPWELDNLPGPELLRSATRRARYDEWMKTFVR